MHVLERSPLHSAALGAFVLLGALIAAKPAHAVGAGCSPGANTFCVTNTNDTVDTGSPNYAGSLRKAMADANSAGGSNTIGFNIAGSGLHTIALAAPLPAISTDLTIDGFSQPGSVQNTNGPSQGGLTATPMIQIVGTNGPGFYYECCAGTFRTLTYQGLALHGFGTAIQGQNNTLTPKAQINVYGCFIGTAADGNALPAAGNSGSAINLGFDKGQVGGTQAWQRNLLSGNGGAGVLASPGDPGTTVVVEGNLIGTDAGGTLPIPNGVSSNWPGVYIQGAASNVRIGCTAAGCSGAASRNVISGNHTFGISLAPNIGGAHFSGLEIKGNYIGTDWTGAPLPNGYPDDVNAVYGGGIQVSSNTNVTAAIIGGFGAGEPNRIAFNHGAGINGTNFFNGQFSYFENRGNEVHDNAGPGQVNIAIGPIGVGGEPLANDAGDLDGGSNGQQNFPEVYTAEPVRGPNPGEVSMLVTYRVTSAAANALYPIRVDFHYAVNGGTGLRIAHDDYQAAAGQGYVTVVLPVTLPVAGGGPWYAFWGPLVATATNASGYSSEISPVIDDWIFSDGFE